MATPAAPRQPVTWAWTPARILLIAATVLFVIASLAAGGVINEDPWAFGFGALAAWALAWALP